MRKKVSLLYLIGTIAFFTGCASDSTFADTENIEEQRASIEESVVSTDRVSDAALDSSGEAPGSEEESSLDLTTTEQEASDVPLYNRIYLEKDGEGYIYRLSDPNLIAKYNELYADAFKSVVDSYNERISWMNQNYKSDQRGVFSNLLSIDNRRNQVINTGSDFELDYNFDLLNVGYTYVDLDSDGIFELIFGVLSYVYNDGLPMDVYERAFALSDDKVVKILEGGSRTNQWLGSDGHIYEYESGGAAYSGTSRLHFDKSELEGNENDADFGYIGFVEDEFVGYWEVPVHIIGPITDIDAMAKLKENQITDDECGALLKEWNEKRVRIDWLRLSDYLEKK